MKGMLNKTGYLYIERGPKEEMKRQYCPYAHHQLGEIKGQMACGDWCPLFGEPNKQNNGKTKISFCDMSFRLFDEFEDQRG